MAEKTFTQLVEEVQELKDTVATQIDLDDSKKQIADLEERFDDAEEEGLPPHFHKVDRIAVVDLQGGFESLSSTPTHVSEEGKLLFYTVGSTSYMATKLGQTWKKVELTDI
jgi:hypothetical protein